MLFSRKIVFSVLIFFLSVFCFGQNQIEKYDSMRYSFLPKYEAYGRFFDPFKINQTKVYFIDFGFKWHAKKARYFKTHFFAAGNPIDANLQILSFSAMYRLTPKKIDWVHLEVQGGLFIGHQVSYIIWYKRDWLSIGMTLGAELQFDVGNRFNISLAHNFYGYVGRSFTKQTNFSVSYPLPADGVKIGNYFPYPPYIQIGFNFYFSNRF